MILTYVKNLSLSLVFLWSSFLDFLGPWFWILFFLGLAWIWVYFLQPFGSGRYQVFTSFPVHLFCLALGPLIFLGWLLFRRKDILDQPWDLTPFWGSENILSYFSLVTFSLPWLIPWFWIIFNLWSFYIKDPWVTLVESFFLYFLQFDLYRKIHEFWHKLGYSFLHFASWPSAEDEYSWWRKPLCILLRPLWVSHFRVRKIYMVLWLVIFLVETVYQRAPIYNFLVYYSYYLALIQYLKLFWSQGHFYPLNRWVSNSNYLYGGPVIYPERFRLWTHSVMKSWGYPQKDPSQDYSGVNPRELAYEPQEFGSCLPRGGLKHYYRGSTGLRWTHTLAFAPLPRWAWARLWLATSQSQPLGASEALALYGACPRVYDYVEFLTGKSQKLLNTRGWGQEFQELLVWAQNVRPKNSWTNNLGSALDALALASLKPEPGNILYQTTLREKNLYDDLPRSQALPDALLETTNGKAAWVDFKRPLFPSQERTICAGGNILIQSSPEHGRKCLAIYECQVDLWRDLGKINDIQRIKILESLKFMTQNIDHWPVLWKHIQEQISLGTYNGVPIPSIVKKGPWDDQNIHPDRLQEWKKKVQFYQHLDSQNSQDFTHIPKDWPHWKNADFRGFFQGAGEYLEKILNSG